MTRVELCEALAIDYATRAKILSIKFDDAYNKYLKRCEIRSYENLLQQFTVGNLSNQTYLLEINIFQQSFFLLIRAISYRFHIQSL